jgi:hypothetical protein
MESKTFKLGFSTRYRYRYHEEPVSLKSGFWLRGAVWVHRDLFPELDSSRHD